jgi:hypothetical protein
MDDLIENYGNFEICKDFPSAKNTMDELDKISVEIEPWMITCPPPCQQTFYNLKIKKFHQV